MVSRNFPLIFIISSLVSSFTYEFLLLDICENQSTAQATCSGPGSFCWWAGSSPAAAMDSLFGNKSAFKVKLHADVFYAIFIFAT